MSDRGGFGSRPVQPERQGRDRGTQCCPETVCEPVVGRARAAECGNECLGDLDQAPLAPPAPLDDATLIPIDALLYRGRAALERAIEVRDLIRLSGGNTEESLSELFDLLDLAAAD